LDRSRDGRSIVRCGSAQSLDCHANRRRPAPCHFEEAAGRRIVLAEYIPNERFNLARVECEVGSLELEHLPLPPQPLDRERRLGP